MAEEDAAAAREFQLLALKAGLADATSAVAGLDMSLVMLLSDILHPPPFPQPDLELASIIVFSQNTIERRLDIVRKMISYRLKGLLDQKPHEYGYKVAAFLIKAFNLVAADATKDVWIRNTAAHGNILVPQTGEPTIIPLPFDYEGVRRHNERRGVKRTHPHAPFPQEGFTAAELQAFAKANLALHGQFHQIRVALSALLAADAKGLEPALVALGRDWKLQPPLQVRPHRERRTRGRKG